MKIEDELDRNGEEGSRSCGMAGYFRRLMSIEELKAKMKRPTYVSATAPRTHSDSQKSNTSLFNTLYLYHLYTNRGSVFISNAQIKQCSVKRHFRRYNPKTTLRNESKQLT